MPKKYSESSIKVYKGLDGVRKNPSMYIGSKDENGVFHLLKEVVENSIDEYFAGENNYIYVHYNQKLNQFTVIDKGRGIPVGKHPKEKVSTLTLIMTKLHAGGKFDSKSYSISRGVHGLGISVVNALSSNLSVYTFRDGKWYIQSFSKGKPDFNEPKKVILPDFLKEIPYKNVKPKTNRGTIISFVPDKSIFKKAKVKPEVIKDWLSKIAYLNSGLEIVFMVDNKLDVPSKTKKKPVIFYHKDGNLSYLKDKLKELKANPVGKPFVFDKKGVQVSLQWSDVDDENLLESFVSGSLTLEGGTHVKGLYNVLSKVLRELSPKKYKFSINDVKNGLIGFINYKTRGAEFSTQHKTELVSKQAEKDVQDVLYKPLKSFFNKNKTTLKEILKRADSIRQAREKAKEIRKIASKIKTNKTKTILPGKLFTSLTDKPEKRELFLVEGDSAKGTAKYARNIKYQEVLTLKGKPINAVKEKSIVKILNNEEVKNILLALGVDVKSLKDKDKNYRVGKIITLCDADADGKHIVTLLLGIFYKLLPDLFEKGMVYVCDAPLYMATDKKGNRYFGNSLKEVEKKIPKKDKNNVRITRMKGWGEVNWKVLREIAFNPKNRKLFKIKAIKKEDEIRFYKLVGEDSKTRKEILGIL